MIKVIIDEKGNTEECKFLTLNSDGSVKVDLRGSYNFDGSKDVKELKMREPTMADNTKHSQNGSIESEMPFLADLLLLSPKDMQLLSERDYKRLQKARSSFLED